MTTREPGQVGPAELSPDEAAAIAAHMPERFLLCREIGHNWRPFFARYHPEQSAYERTLRCNRCRSERSQTVNSRGEIVGGGYDYVDGYQLKGKGRMTGGGRAALRLESILRTVARTDEGAA